MGDAFLPVIARYLGAREGRARPPRCRGRLSCPRPSGAYVPAMPKIIVAPQRMQAVGTKPKIIEEYVGNANTGESAISIAHMRSPAGWVEPGQRPEFREYTLVLGGMIRVDHEGGTLEVRRGQAVVTEPGEWVRYSTPEEGGAEYIAVCTPAFAYDAVHRDEG